MHLTRPETELLLAHLENRPLPLSSASSWRDLRDSIVRKLHAEVAALETERESRDKKQLSASDKREVQNFLTCKSPYKLKQDQKPVDPSSITLAELGLD